MLKFSPWVEIPSALPCMAALPSHFPDERATVPGPQPFLPVRLGFPILHVRRSLGSPAGLRSSSSPAAPDASHFSL
jgi:hypothetical protein